MVILLDVNLIFGILWVLLDWVHSVRVKGDELLLVFTGGDRSTGKTEEISSK
jgi:hypothetical protein